MMNARYLTSLRKSFLVWLVVWTGMGMIMGCGGGGGGSNPNLTSAGNQEPTVSISSPAGAYFKEGENIVFEGTGSDPQDGPLNGGSLVWESDKDGIIGTGATLITSALSAGDHDIKLTATDSDGAAASSMLTEQISVAPTRFIKIGSQTTGVLDAHFAFDGDLTTTNAIIDWPWDEDGHFDFLHFRAYLGAVDTFVFRIAVGGPSTPGSSLIIDGQTGIGTWQNLFGVDLDKDKTLNIQIPNAQSYKDSDGYINLRIRWAGGQSQDEAAVYEIWRADPLFAVPQTSQGVSSSELAFDGDPLTIASVPAFPEFLQFKFYVGPAPSAVFQISLDELGNYNTLFIDAESAPTVWSTVSRIDFTSTQTKTLTITVADVQSYLDADGYISLRALWTGPSPTDLKIRELRRSDPFFEGLMTIGVVDPAFAVDGKLNTSAQIDYFWDEEVHQDFLHLETFVGDADDFTFYSSLSQSTAGSHIAIDAEIEPGVWSPLTSISLDSTVDSAPITITNAHDYTDADGFLSLRFKWEGGEAGDTAYALINEISQQNY